MKIKANKTLNILLWAAVCVVAVYAIFLSCTDSRPLAETSTYNAAVISNNRGIVLIDRDALILKVLGKVPPDGTPFLEPVNREIYVDPVQPTEEKVKKYESGGGLAEPFAPISYKRGLFWQTNMTRYFMDDYEYEIDDMSREILRVGNFKNLTRTVRCSIPGCRHKDDSCPAVKYAWIERKFCSPLDCFLFTGIDEGGNILLTSLSYDLSPGKIMSVVSNDYGRYIYTSPTPVAADENYLYFMAEDDRGYYYLMEVDPYNGRSEAILTFKGRNAKVMRVYREKIVFRDKNLIILWDRLTGEALCYKLHTFDEGSHSVSVINENYADGNILITLSPGPGRWSTIFRLSLENGETYTYENIPPLGSTWFHDIGRIYDDKLLIGTLDYLYIIDLETGRQSMCNTNLLSNTTEAWKITQDMYDVGDGFVLCHRYDDVYLLWYRHYRDKDYAYISKDDFYRGNNNYILFRDY